VSTGVCGAVAILLRERDGEVDAVILRGPVPVAVVVKRAVTLFVAPDRLTLFDRERAPPRAGEAVRFTVAVVRFCDGATPTSP